LSPDQVRLRRIGVVQGQDVIGEQAIGYTDPLLAGTNSS